MGSDSALSRAFGGLLPVPRRRTTALLGALALVVGVRVLPLPSIYQHGGVVFSGNDPYAYRHAVAIAIERGGSLPGGVAQGEPLLVTTLWIASVLLGGSQWAADTVVAWYPVVSALATAVLVYGMATHASGDTRVGLAAVSMLAVTPAHAYRTSLGFADHHAFDYLWVALTGYALLVLLAGSDRRRSRWVHVVALGVGIGGQLLAWEAGALLVVPVGLSVAVTAVAFAGDDPPALSRLAAVVVGIAFATALTLLAHLGLGWHSATVPAAGGLLLVGSVGVLSLTWVVRALDASRSALFVGEIGWGILALAVLAVLPVDVLGAFFDGIGRLQAESAIGETGSLVDAYGVVAGPLVLLGFAPVLAAIGLVTAFRRTETIAWAVVAIYTGYFFLLAMTQRRFAGELAPSLAVLAGFGLVALLARLGVVAPLQPTTDGGSPADASVVIPDRSRLAVLGGVVGVVAGTGTLYSALVNSRLTIDDGAVRAARWMDGYADDRGWSRDERFVFSEWGRNRMFNYVVSGQAGSYSYAKRYYEDFLLGINGRRWYDRLTDRVRFVVVETFDELEATSSRRMYTRLRQFGSATDQAPGLGNYRAVYASPGHRYVVYTLVPGAKVSGRVETERSISTSVTVPGAEFEYRRTVDPDPDGSFTVVVAHSGTYRLGDREISVSESAVRNGATVEFE